MKKQKDPAFLFYSGDFLAGTYTMSFEERGKYITLLCIQHQKGFVTDGDMKSVLNEEDIIIAEKFIKKTDGKWYNERLEDVIERRKVFTESRRNNGSKGGRPKKQTIEKPYGNHMETISKPNENHTGTGTGTGNSNLKLVTGNKIDSIENNITDKDTKELLNKFDKMFSDGI